MTDRAVLARSVLGVRVPRYDTGGSYPQVRRDDVDLRAVNAALRRVVLADQQRYAPSARAAAKVAGEDARGVYQASVDRRLLSASTVVVSVLMPVIELYPGGTEGSGWVAGTVRVPSGASVRLTDLFARPTRALPVLAREWKEQFRRAIPRRWVCVTQLPSFYTPSASNYRNFALTPRGLAVGIHGHASCARLQATVPYAVLRPYLSKLGTTLIAGVRRSGNGGPPPGLSSRRLSDGSWYGKVVRANVARRTLTFAPACRFSASRRWIPATSRAPVTITLAPHAALAIYYRPNGSAAAGHSQRADWKLLADVAEHGRLPAFPPGWFITLQNRAAVSIEEDSGISSSGAADQQRHGCVWSRSTGVFVNG